MGSGGVHLRAQRQSFSSDLGGCAVVSIDFFASSTVTFSNGRESSPIGIPPRPPQPPMVRAASGISGCPIGEATITPLVDAMRQAGDAARTARAGNAVKWGQVKFPASMLGWKFDLTPFSHSLNPGYHGPPTRV